MIRNDDKKNAGYNPANMPTSSVKPIPTAIALNPRKNQIEICFPASSLKYGSKTQTIPMASIVDKRVNMTDSTKNWVTSHSLSEPITLRMPTSFERLDELAVDRFVKLIQARSRINTANAPKMYT